MLRWTVSQGFLMDEAGPETASGATLRRQFQAHGRLFILGTSSICSASCCSYVVEVKELLTHWKFRACLICIKSVERTQA